MSLFKKSSNSKEKSGRYQYPKEFLSLYLGSFFHAELVELTVSFGISHLDWNFSPACFINLKI